MIIIVLFYYHYCYYCDGLNDGSLRVFHLNPWSPLSIIFCDKRDSAAVIRLKLLRREVGRIVSDGPGVITRSP